MPEYLERAEYISIGSEHLSIAYLVTGSLNIEEWPFRATAVGYVSPSLSVWETAVYSTLDMSLAAGYPVSVSSAGQDR